MIDMVGNRPHGRSPACCVKMSSAWRPIGLVALLVAASAACEGPSLPEGCVLGDSTRPISGSFATWNLYLGASVHRLLLADSAQRPSVVEQGFAQVLATDFAERATAIAAVLDPVRPDLIGLQEVARWFVQSPGDESGDNPTPARDTVADHLALLQAALAARGLRYWVVAASINVDEELPSADGRDVRFQDRDAILAREGVTTFNPQSGTFGSLRIGDISIVRGWLSVDAVIGGDTVRFVTTHLETQELGPIQREQANALLETWCNASLSLVAAGDFNADPRDSVLRTYNALIGAGLTDAWRVAHPGLGGLSCCQASDLRNPVSSFSERVDHVLFRGQAVVTVVGLLGAEPSQRTVSGMWPSDHAGVVAMLRAPR